VEVQKLKEKGDDNWETLTPFEESKLVKIAKARALHPISSSDCKRELSKYPSLAALDVVVDKDW
jgi:hypothetical protein